MTSGGATVNDGFFHGAIPTLPFGGVGSSGQGAYRGKASFEVFSHRRSVVKTPGWMEKLLDVRYPPYTAAKLVKFRQTSELKPNFDRQGNQIKGLKYWLGLVCYNSKSIVNSFPDSEFMLCHYAKLYSKTYS